MVAPDFSQINRAERDKLSRLLGGPELAQRFWDEAVRPMVEGFDRYAVRPDALFARKSRLRYGSGLDKHMKQVAKAANGLRELLDDDTLLSLVLPPSNVHRVDDLSARQERNIQRVRDLRRLLEELVFEIEVPRADIATGKTTHLSTWGRTFVVDKATGERRIQFEGPPLGHRLDCFLASSVYRWVNAADSKTVRPETLLDVVFAALNLDAHCNGKDSIREAKVRELIP